MSIDGRKKLPDVYDEEFRFCVRIAMMLIKRITSFSERKIATQWLKKLRQMEAEIIPVKKNRNEFFRYFLNVLRDGVVASALATPRGLSLTKEERLKLKEEIRHIGEKGAMTYLLEEVFSSRGPEYMARWSEDKRTYIAVCPMPGRGALIYMAASNHPDRGWVLRTDAPIGHDKPIPPST